MLTPQKVDTNSLFVTGQLNAVGVEVIRKTITGDERDLLAETVRAALGRAAIVLVTGGLGPTEDDVTRDAVSQALGRPLVFSPRLLAELEEKFRRFGRPMAENNKRQAYLIEGADALDNPRGTACGQWIEDGDRVVALLPGPPRELKPMVVHDVIPRIARRLPPLVIRTRLYRVAGMGESDLDALIAPVYTKFTNPATTILAAAGDVQIHLRARCATAEEAEALLAQCGDPIAELLGDRIYSTNGDPLEAVIGERLRAAGQTLAVAESCTGGLVGGRLTGVAGSSKYFLGGALTYTDAMKVKLLGVDAELLERHTAVSEAAALAMAEGVRAVTGADWGLAVTGEAGPEPATPAPVGTVFLAVAGPGGSEAQRVQFPGDRDRVRQWGTQAALNFLRRKLGR
jgi:nicotinamide-nucleotide amidase